ncbi:STAS domain-containing protein [Streptomyces sp. NPDC055189]
MSFSPFSSARLVVFWTSRPLGVRLAGVLDTDTERALEECLAELLARHRGRVVHVDLTAVSSVSVAAAALLVAVDERARRGGGEVRLHLTAELEHRCETTVRAQQRVPPCG